MSSNKSQPIGQVQLPQCQICNLQPIPQSVQHVPFIMLEIFLFLISVKLAIIFLFFSYCVSRNAWYCPQCKRQVQVNYQVQGITENLIIRMGNCMFMLSKFKFRVIAALISAYILYLLVLEVYEKPKNSIQKTWISLANNCGYEAYLENAFRANELYAKYPQLGEWNITGIFLKQEEIGMQKLRKFYIKMRPTQFKNPLAEDIVVLITSHTQVEGTDFAMADLIEFKGQWEGRQNAHLKFVATGVRKLGSRFSPTDVQLLTEAEKFIRVHEKQSRRTRQQHQRHVDDQIKAITKKQ